MARLSCVIGLASSLVMGCTWVETQTGAETITLKTLEQVSTCQRLGTATAQTKDRVAFYRRDTAKVASELLSLARNEALSLGGDALVVLGEPDQGIQRFGVYRCGAQ